MYEKVGNILKMAKQSNTAAIGFICMDYVMARTVVYAAEGTNTPAIIMLFPEHVTIQGTTGFAGYAAMVKELAEQVKELELAKQKGMKSIAVTAYQYSPVSRIADLLLLSTPRGKRDNSMFRISRLSEMMVLEVLARILESTMENGNRTIMESEMFLSGTKF